MLNLDDQRISSCPDCCSRNTSSFLGFSGTPTARATKVHITATGNITGEIQREICCFPLNECESEKRERHLSWTDTGLGKMRHELTATHSIHAVGQQRHLSTVTDCDEWCVILAVLPRDDTHSLYPGMWQGIHNVSYSRRDTLHKSIRTSQRICVHFICINALWRHLQQKTFIHMR